MLGNRAIVSFTKEETAAANVDWIVLTAALVGLSLAILNLIGGGMEDLSSELRNYLLRDRTGSGF